TRGIFLVVGSASALTYTTAILTLDPELLDSGTYLLNRLPIVLILVGASIRRPLVGIAWSLAGFGCSLMVLAATSLLTGISAFSGRAPAVALLIFCGAYLALALLSAN